MKINFILDRLLIYFQVNTLSELANKLGVLPSTLSNWKKRNTIDFELIFTKCENINYNWLIRGNGNMLIDENASKDADDQSSIIAEKDNEIKLLNREIGKLQYQIDILKKDPTFQIAAEPKPAYKKSK